MKHYLLTISFILFAITPKAQTNITPEMLEQARAMGVSQQQINDYTSKSSLKPTIPQQPSGVSAIENKSVSLNAMQSAKTVSQSNEQSIYGHKLFSNSAASFVPNLKVATPKNYILGIGDEVIVQIWGNSELNETVPILADGTLSLPTVGPVQLSGCSIEAAEQKIKDKLKKVVSGLGNTSQVKVSLAKIRSIQVNILGEVQTPGSYTLPSVATLFNAIYSAGGMNEIGSIREIKLVRSGKQIGTYDLYAFLFNGQDNFNTRLEDNDVIIIPPYSNIVTISGAIKRPMKYEIRPSETVKDLLIYSGGFAPNAYNQKITIDRAGGEMRSILSIDSDKYSSTSLQNGDSLNIESVIDLYTNRLTIEGAVWRPGHYAYGEEVNTLSQLIHKAKGMRGNQFSDRGYLKRLKPDFTYESVSFSLKEVLNGKDLALQANDSIVIPSREKMEESKMIAIQGEVNKPMTIPFSEKMTIEDAILLAGGLKESASTAKLQVSRRITNPAAMDYSSHVVDTFTFRINKDLSLHASSAQFTLQPYDQIFVRRSPAFSEQNNIQVVGEVLFAGTYAVNRDGSHLSQVLGRTGGFTPLAYTRGISVERKMTADEYKVAQAKVDALKELSTKKDSLSTNTLTIKDTYRVGIDAERALKNPESEYDIILRDGDIIHVPEFQNTVKMSGAVLYENSVSYMGSSLPKYISEAGGYANGARKAPFVIYMNGRVASTKSFLGIKSYPKIEPGCEIIVPNKPASTGSSVGEILSLAMMGVNTAAIVANLFR